MEDKFIEINDDTVDVQKIMEDIKNSLKERGIQEVDFPDILSLANQNDMSANNMQEDIATINSEWEVVADRPITSHRKVLGPIIVFFKKAIRKCLRWYINPIVDKQRTFNSAAVRLINGLKNNQDEDKIKISEMEAKIARLEQDLQKGDSARRMQAVENNVRDLNILIQKQKDISFITSERVRRIEGALKKEGKIGVSSNSAPKIDYEGADMDYFLFEQMYRGSREEIKKRQRVYLKYLEDKKNILDIGCGRGELIELIMDEGNIGVKGIDLDDDMIIYCSEKGLPVEKADAISYLEKLKPGEIDGIYMGQVVEHLSPADMVRVVRLANEKLAKGGVFIAETLNPMCLYIFAHAFYMDTSHVKPVHPFTLEFIMQTNGFRNVETIYLSPVQEKLSKLKGSNIENLEEFNKGIDRLNELLFSNQDYAIIGWK
jgi:2-polyprenyl-3-methyl-5-hydroxy-6-metoxy-1,4-benzoquinol methylase